MVGPLYELPPHCPYAPTSCWAAARKGAAATRAAREEECFIVAKVRVIRDQKGKDAACCDCKESQGIYRCRPPTYIVTIQVMPYILPLLKRNLFRRQYKRCEVLQRVFQSNEMLV